MSLQSKTRILYYYRDMKITFPAACFLVFVFPFFSLYSGGRSANRNVALNDNPSPLSVEFAQISSNDTYDTPLEEAKVEPESATLSPPSMSRAEEVFRAFAAGYPDRIRAVEFYDGDWTIVV